MRGGDSAGRICFSLERARRWWRVALDDRRQNGGRLRLQCPLRLMCFSLFQLCKARQLYENSLFFPPLAINSKEFCPSINQSLRRRLSVSKRLVAADLEVPKFHCCLDYTSRIIFVSGISNANINTQRLHKWKISQFL